MSNTSSEVRDAQLTFVSAYVRQLDPSVTDAGVTRYLTEIETMAEALQTLRAPDTGHVEPFTPEWLDGEAS